MAAKYGPTRTYIRFRDSPARVRAEQKFSVPSEHPMATTSKENEVLTAPPETAARSATPAPRFDETATGSRPQPVALEVPVTVNGARAVEGTDKREPFSETTKTVLVFGNGAVIRLGSPVAAGQLLFLTNEKTKKEVVCQVVKSKNYKSVSGYVELEFTESVVGFWGMRFPSDRIGTPAPAPVAALPSAPKPNPVAPVVPAPKPVSPVVSTAPKAPEVKPPQIPSPQIHAEVKPAPQIRPAELAVAPPAALKPPAPPVQAAVVPPPPVAKQPDVPVIPPPPVTSSLASSLASLLSAPEVLPASAPSKPPVAPLTSETKAQPSTVPAQNSSEDLKLQAARLQEQLSSMLFSAAPTAQPAPPAPVVPALDPKAISGVASQVLEMAKAEPAPIKSAPPAKPVPLPMKSSLDTEEVKIPSWLEPLARNAASAAPTPETVEREKAKHFSEITAPLEDSAEPLPLTAVESIPESAIPAFGSLLPLDEPVITEARSSGSNRGVLYGAIAAGVLVAVGGAWYLLHPSDAGQGKPGIAASTPSSQVSAALPAPSVSQPAAQPVAQPASQNIQAGITPDPNSSAKPISTAPISSSPAASAPLTRPAVSTEPVPATRENTRGASTPIPASATERISRPPAEPEPKKPALGEVHLASPTINRRASSQEDGAEAPTISAGSADPNAGGMEAGLAPGSGKQPAAPEVPLPVGGDVKTAKLISSVSPTYPLLAKNQHISGDVLIDALIDANGRVTTMKVISGPTLLHQSAMAALRLWKYQPASLDGKAVPMHLTVTIQFRLQ
jgi:TonB family protein